MIHHAPIMLGNGTRLFDNIDKVKFSVDKVEAGDSALVTHLRYKVKINECSSGGGSLK